MSDQTMDCRYFVSYSGVALPLKLINELQDSERENRNTFFCGYYDGEQRLMRCEKRVYGETELLHVYTYHDNGALKQAEITDADGELTVMSFDLQGKLLS
jgi:hypothetical protein